MASVESPEQAISAITTPAEAPEEEPDKQVLLASVQELHGKVAADVSYVQTVLSESSESLDDGATVTLNECAVTAQRLIGAAKKDPTLAKVEEIKEIDQRILSLVPIAKQIGVMRTLFNICTRMVPKRFRGK